MNLPAPTSRLDAFVDSASRALIRWRLPLSMIFLAITVALGASALRVHLDPGFNKLIPLKHAFMEAFLKHSGTFAGANRILVNVKWKGEGDIYNAEFMKAIRGVTDDVFFTPGVNRAQVFSIFTPNVKYIEVTEEGFAGEVVIPSRFEADAEGLAKVRANVARSGEIGLPVVADLGKMPHCLVAGTTGSGKSVGINGMILSLLYKAEPRDVRLIMIDPKMLEMSMYEGIPHLLCPVVTDMKQAGNALNWAVGEMERRYKLMSKMGVRNLAGYNKKIDEAKARGDLIGNPFSLTPEAPEPLDRLPHVVIVIDELADLMMVVGKKIEELIARLAQKARAAGIHLILATQRPSVDVITGLIKANIPTRISFQVSSKIDSRTILDQMGAEALLGMGDMLYMASGSGLPVRVHGAFVSDEEVHRVVESLKSQGEPNYIEGILEGGTLDGDAADGGAGGAGGGDGESDPMYDQAVAIVLEHRKASISLVQRHLRIGYNRAARLLEQMEKSGLVTAMSTNGNREIVLPKRDE